MVENMNKELYNKFNENLKSIKELYKNNPSKIKKDNFNNIKITNEYNEKSLCLLIDDINEWSNWTIQISEEIIKLPIEFAKFIINITDEVEMEILNLTSDELVLWINKKLELLLNSNDKIIIKKIIKNIKLLSLKIKKLIYEAQLIIYRNTKIILESLANGKIIELNESFEWALNSLKTCSDVISAGLSAINLSINMLPQELILKGGHMAFLLTPKILMNNKLALDMTPTEPNNDLSGFSGMQIVDKIVNDYIKSIKDINISECISYISSKLTEYINTGKITTGEPNLKNIEYKKLKDIINTALNTLLLNVSEPLPKYEKISITNVRYLLWLTSVFEPAMKMSYGIPGMP